MELAYSNLMTTSIDTKELDPEEHVKRGRKSLNPLNHKFLSPAKTLSSILEKHRIPIVDLLSIDLEGYEIEALKGANLESGKIRNIVIECRDASRAASFLSAYNFKLIKKLSHHDYLFSIT